MKRPVVLPARRVQKILAFRDETSKMGRLVEWKIERGIGGKTKRAGGRGGEMESKEEERAELEEKKEGRRDREAGLSGG